MEKENNLLQHHIISMTQWRPQVPQALNWSWLYTPIKKYFTQDSKSFSFWKSVKNKQTNTRLTAELLTESCRRSCRYPLPQGLNHLSFIPPALLSGHIAEAPVPAILYCAAGEKNETAQVCLPAVKRLWSRVAGAMKPGWLWQGVLKTRYEQAGSEDRLQHSVWTNTHTVCSIQAYLECNI